jgi:hypothetical protein
MVLNTDDDGPNLITNPDKPNRILGPGFSKRRANNATADGPSITTTDADGNVSGAQLNLSGMLPDDPLPKAVVIGIGLWVAAKVVG